MKFESHRKVKQGKITSANNSRAELEAKLQQSNDGPIAPCNTIAVFGKQSRLQKLRKTATSLGCAVFERGETAMLLQHDKIVDILI